MNTKFHLVNIKNKAEFEHKWNEMHLDRDNWIESNQLLSNAVSKSILIK